MRNKQPFQWRSTVVSLFTRITGTRWLRLNYDGQLAAFAIGETVTEDSVGAATGVIVYLTATTMYFASITGTFGNDESILGDVLGSAVANGTQY